jgi:hypothetical protein
MTDDHNQNPIDLEQIYATDLRERKAIKRSQTAPKVVEIDEEPTKKHSGIKGFCCVAVIVLLIASGYLIYVVAVKMKDPLYQEWLKNKESIFKTGETFKDIQNKVEDKVKQGTETYDKIKDTADQAQTLKNKADEIEKNLNASADVNP